MEVQNLSVAFGSEGHYLHAVNGVSLHIERGEVVGIIGQSGSGKTTLVMAMLGLLPGSPGVWHGEARLEGKHLLPPVKDFVKGSQAHISKREIPFLSAQKRLLEDLRGRDVVVIFQEPRAALDPYFKIGEHLIECLRRAKVSGNSETLRNKAVELLQDVGLVDSDQLWNLYPHEISGGMAQRVMIAMALCAKPKLLVADEPSTALDVTTQAKLLELFQKLRDKHGLSILLISHDIGVIQEICKRVYVMHRGALVECGATEGVIKRFSHPYTGSLIEAFVHFGHTSVSDVQPPSHPEQGQGCAYRLLCAGYSRLSQDEKTRCNLEKPLLQNQSPIRVDTITWARCHYPDHSKSHAWENVSFRTTKPGANPTSKPLVVIRNLKKRFIQGKKSFWGLDNVSMTLEEGKTYALVGESGSGKSTLALSLMSLQKVDSGEILYKGENLLTTSKKRMQTLRHEIRMLFQHPEAVLNSGMTIEASLAEGLEIENKWTREEIKERVAEALAQVRLDGSHAKRYPSNLSSGEKQRVTIARALITKPRLLVCDEPVASLDLAIQSQVMGLLQEFQLQLGLTFLFISHNLELVKLLAHRIGVMYMGQLIEESDATDFTVERARHPYTRLLLASVPSMGEARLREICSQYPDVEPQRLSGGCPFRNRCPLYLKDHRSECEKMVPPLKELVGGARVACHMVVENLA